MKRFPDKQRVLERVIEELQHVAAQMAQAAENTRAGATHEEAKPENDKDTRALEQSYLARGQAMRVEEVLEHVQVLRYLNLASYSEDDVISAGAMIALESDDAERCVFLLPHGGGIEVKVDGVDVQVITAISPLGKAVLGKSVGDEVVLKTRGQAREYEIVAIK